MLGIPQWPRREPTGCGPAEPVAGASPTDLAPRCSLTGTRHLLPASPGAPLRQASRTCSLGPDALSTRLLSGSLSPARQGSAQRASPHRDRSGLSVCLSVTGAERYLFVRTVGLCHVETLLCPHVPHGTPSTGPPVRCLTDACRAAEWVTEMSCPLNETSVAAFAEIEGPGPAAREFSVRSVTPVLPLKNA